MPSSLIVNCKETTKTFPINFYHTWEIFLSVNLNSNYFTNYHNQFILRLSFSLLMWVPMYEQPIQEIQDIFRRLLVWMKTSISDKWITFAQPCLRFLVTNINSYNNMQNLWHEFQFLNIFCIIEIFSIS